jgi:hypothetical protein
MLNPRARLTVRQLVAAVAISVALLAFLRQQLFYGTPGDLMKWIVCAVDGHRTVYAKGYSESAFRSLRLGMTDHQVGDVLGPPLRREEWYAPDGAFEQYWVYTRPSKTMGSYWRREVEFRDGVVSYIRAYYYVD